MLVAVFKAKTSGQNNSCQSKLFQSENMPVSCSKVSSKKGKKTAETEQKDICEYQNENEKRNENEESQGARF